MLLLHEVGLVVHGSDHGVDVGQLAPQPEIGSRATLQLFDHVAPADGHLLDGPPHRTGRHGGRHIAQVAVELRPCAQETAPGTAASLVVGSEERTLEAPGRIDLLGILAFGVGKGAQYAGYGRRQAPGSLHLLFQLLACEVTQRIVRRAPRTQRSDILTVVIAVQQPHRVGIGPVHPFEDLPDDGLGIETLGVGIERILLQPGYQTIIIRREHSVTP